MKITREKLLDLLTTAATIGRNELSTATTRGDITDAIERTMRKQLDTTDDGMVNQKRGELLIEAALAFHDARENVGNWNTQQEMELNKIRLAGAELRLHDAARQFRVTPDADDQGEHRHPITDLAVNDDSTRLGTSPTIRVPGPEMIGYAERNSGWWEHTPGQYPDTGTWTFIQRRTPDADDQGENVVTLVQIPLVAQQFAAPDADDQGELPTMDDIYASEVNVSIVSDWDGGYHWKLDGSPYDGTWEFTGGAGTFDLAVLAVRRKFAERR